MAITPVPEIKEEKNVTSKANSKNNRKKVTNKSIQNMVRENSKDLAEEVRNKVSMKEGKEVHNCDAYNNRPKTAADVEIPKFNTADTVQDDRYEQCQERNEDSCNCGLLEVAMLQPLKIKRTTIIETATFVLSAISAGLAVYNYIKKAKH